MYITARPATTAPPVITNPAISHNFFMMFTKEERKIDGLDKPGMRFHNSREFPLVNPERNPAFRGSSADFRLKVAA